jgi:uncharacterized protein with HEPN domain/predicted nucleotidyltransferase
MKTLNEIKKVLLEHRKELKEKYKVKTIGILKDLPKWEQETPDIDILVKFEEGYKNFDNYTDLKNHLEELLNENINLIIKDSIKLKLIKSTEDKLIYKFEKNNKVFLNDILENINYAIEFTKDMDYKEFLRDIMTKDAVSQCFIIIGEASKYLDDDFKEKYNSIPFKKLEEIENSLLYQYWDVDYNLIWKMVKKELPKLKPIIEKILKELDK